MKKKAKSGFLGMYHGPKPRAYSKLSAKDKAKEDRQNERDLRMKKAEKKSTKRTRKG